MGIYKYQEFILASREKIIIVDNQVGIWAHVFNWRLKKDPHFA
jgi:hypothetical protein